MEATQLKCSISGEINILLALDSLSIINGCTNPSLDKKQPIAIKSNMPYIFFPNLHIKQGCSKLNLFSTIGDVIKIRSTSISQNSSASVIIYQILDLSVNGQNDQFVANQYSLANAIQPNPDSDEYDGLPAINVSENFISFDQKIKSAGKKKYRICFALYCLASDGQTQNLFGCFYWDLKLRIIFTKK